MRTRGTPNGGRPSKGDRHFFGSRVPREVALLIQEESDRLDVSYSEYIAHLLGKAHGIEVPLHPSRDRQQKELPLASSA